MSDGLQIKAIDRGNGWWEVWTPDDGHACIGSGVTQDAALRDALQNLLATVEDAIVLIGSTK